MVIFWQVCRVPKISFATQCLGKIPCSSGFFIVVWLLVCQVCRAPPDSLSVCHCPGIFVSIFSKTRLFSLGLNYSVFISLSWYLFTTTTHLVDLGSMGGSVCIFLHQLNWYCQAQPVQAGFLSDRFFSAPQIFCLPHSLLVFWKNLSWYFRSVKCLYFKTKKIWHILSTLVMGLAVFGLAQYFWRFF